MSLTAAMNTGISGLMASQTALRVVSNNVANVNTEGYTRKIANLESRAIDGQGVGVIVGSVLRRVDEFLQRDLRTQISAVGDAVVRDTYFARLQEMFGTPENAGSIAANITDLAARFEALAVNPEAVAPRLAIVSGAVSLTEQFKSMSSSIVALRRTADQEIASAVDSINDLLGRVEDLNQSIARAFAVGQPTGDLEDERDQLVARIAESIEITTFRRDDGEVAIYMRGGKPLLDGTRIPIFFNPAPSLGLTSRYLPPGDPNYGTGGLSGLYLGQNNAPSTDVATTLGSGKLAALFDMRDEVLPDFQTQIDLLARELRDEINVVHNAGTGLPAASTLTGSHETPALIGGITSGIARIAVVSPTGQIQGRALDLNLAVGHFDLDATNLDSAAAIGTSVTQAGLFTVADSFGATRSVAATFTKTAANNWELALATDNVGFGSSTLTFAAGVLTSASPLRYSVPMENGARVDLVLTVAGLSQNAAPTAISSASQPLTLQRLVDHINDAAGDQGTGMTAALVNDKLQLRANSAAYGIAIDSYSSRVAGTELGLSAYFGLNDMFSGHNSLHMLRGTQAIAAPINPVTTGTLSFTLADADGKTLATLPIDLASLTFPMTAAAFADAITAAAAAAVPPVALTARLDGSNHLVVAANDWRHQVSFAETGNDFGGNTTFAEFFGVELQIDNSIAAQIGVRKDITGNPALVSRAMVHTETANSPGHRLLGTEAIAAATPIVATGSVLFEIVDESGAVQNNSLVLHLARGRYDFDATVLDSATAIGGTVSSAGAFSVLDSSNLVRNFDVTFRKTGAAAWELTLASGTTRLGPFALTFNPTGDLTSTGVVRGQAAFAGGATADIALELTGITHIAAASTVSALNVPLTLQEIADEITAIGATQSGILSAVVSNDRLQLSTANTTHHIVVRESHVAIGAQAEGFAEYFGLPRPGAAVRSGDGTAAGAIAQRFNAEVDFASTGGLPPLGTTLAGYATQILSNNASQAASVADTRGFRERLAADIENKVGSLSGVNMDEELANMVILQNAYSASARVITTASEMFEVLTKM
jgi:flagellar hook-associated protein FlgK